VLAEFTHCRNRAQTRGKSCTTTGELVGGQALPFFDLHPKKFADDIDLEAGPRSRQVSTPALEPSLCNVAAATAAARARSARERRARPQPFGAGAFAAFMGLAAAHRRASATGCIDMGSIRRRPLKNADFYVSFFSNHANRFPSSEASALHGWRRQSVLRVTGSLVGVGAHHACLSHVKCSHADLSVSLRQVCEEVKALRNNLGAHIKGEVP
jgi:hypothetical protein